MAIDPANLPDRKWLTLFEATTYLALGEALSIDALRWRNYPSARAWLPQIKSAWDRCRNEARVVKGGYSEFLKMIDSYSRDPFHPPPSSVLRHVDRWPPSGRFLYEAILGWEQAHDQDESARVKAEPLILQALLSDEVLFRGNRGGREECIELLHFDGAPRFDFYNSTIEASASEPNSDGGRTLKWTGVNIELGSLVGWAKVQNPTAPGDTAPAQTAHAVAGTSPVQKPRTPRVDLARTAIAAVFPDGVPPTMLAKERDRAINQWIENQSDIGVRYLPSRTINRALTGR